jgi:hypothetical protein
MCYNKRVINSMADAKKKPTSLERFNVWRLYVPDGKKDLLYRFFDLAQAAGKSRSQAIIEAVEEYLPLLEQKAQNQKR